jgi:TRAP-type C4-dicarboxylate transport system substrate-binding protein
MIKETSKCKNNQRGWEALEEKLKSRGMSIVEIQEARKSFYDGIEVLSKMFLVCYDTEKNSIV